MEKGKLAILEAEVVRQENEIERIYSKIDRRATHLDSEEATESLAYHLHNLYCAYEDLFKLIAEAFENNVDEGLTWHKELLRRMSLEIKGVRHQVISDKSLLLLSELRAFQHFFRHAYIYELDVKKIKIVLEKAQAVKEVFKKDLHNFMRSLKE
jgi:hypothetical protein